MTHKKSKRFKSTSEKKVKLVAWIRPEVLSTITQIKYQKKLYFGQVIELLVHEYEGKP